MSRLEAIEGLAYVLYDDEAKSLDVSWMRTWDELSGNSRRYWIHKAEIALRALLDGGYVVLTDQLEQVGKMITNQAGSTYFAWPYQVEALETMGCTSEPVFRLASSESPKEPR